ncbi:MAG TPA: thioredoxin domain-containing protein, partial [Candidatus Binatia bacterium]|nr:thioredoxin domain-containing protein [Candidatus Binatia bacterium]
KEIVIVGDRSDARTADLIKEIHSVYLPNKAVQLFAPGEPLEKVSPLMTGKQQIDGRPTAYVCQNFTCSAPVTSWAELKPLLKTDAA